jgi:hypothetical protein
VYRNRAPSWSSVDEWRRDVQRKFFRSLHNSVDTVFTLPQYLVLRTLPVQQVGRCFANVSGI